jgi:hypothetical protein
MIRKLSITLQVRLGLHHEREAYDAEDYSSDVTGRQMLVKGG